MPTANAGLRLIESRCITRQARQQIVNRPVDGMNESKTCCSTDCQWPGTMSSSTKEYFWACCLGATRRLKGGGGKSPAEVVRHVSNDVLRSLVPDCKHVGAGRADNSEHVS